MWNMFCLILELKGTPRPHEEVAQIKRYEMPILQETIQKPKSSADTCWAESRQQVEK